MVEEGYVTDEDEGESDRKKHNKRVCKHEHLINFISKFRFKKYLDVNILTKLLHVFFAEILH